MCTVVGTGFKHSKQKLEQLICVKFWSFLAPPPSAHSLEGPQISYKNNCFDHVSSNVFKLWGEIRQK